MQSLRKALSILKLFGGARSEWTAKEIIAELGFHKSSVQRLLAALEDEGFLTSISDYNRKYKLGMEIFILGKVANRDIDLSSLATPYLEELVAQANETAHLCIEDHGKSLYIAKVECDRSIRVASKTGARLPMHCTGVGKALLSAMPEDKIDRIILQHGLISYTPNTITSREKLFQALKIIKAEGIALDDEEFELGLRCVAAPIFGNEGEIIAAISVSGPVNRITNETVSIYSKYVKASAGKISSLMNRKKGYPSQVESERSNS